MCLCRSAPVCVITGHRAWPAATATTPHAVQFGCCAQITRVSSLPGVKYHALAPLVRRARSGTIWLATLGYPSEAETEAAVAHAKVTAVHEPCKTLPIVVIIRIAAAASDVIFIGSARTGYPITDRIRAARASVDDSSRAAQKRRRSHKVNFQAATMASFHRELRRRQLRLLLLLLRLCRLSHWHCGRTVVLVR